MRARCGRCGSGFEVMAPGRYACPACGTTNEVRGAAAPPGGMGPAGGPPLGPEPPPPPPPERPSARVRCREDECGFSFIVGDVSQAPCPMCGKMVDVGPRPAPPPAPGPSAVDYGPDPAAGWGADTAGGAW